MKTNAFYLCVELIKAPCCIHSGAYLGADPTQVHIISVLLLCTGADISAPLTQEQM